MIDQLAALGKVNSIGRDGFLWWIGQVAHKDSWREVNAAISLRGFKGNRVKVRIACYHIALYVEDFRFLNVLKIYVLLT